MTAAPLAPSGRDFDTLTPEQMRTLDAALAGDGAPRWDAFYQDRARPCPFLVDHPDESLVQALQTQAIGPGRALDLGCGHGRNALHLARQGFAVDAVDHAQTALAWARDRAARAGLHLALHCADVFAFQAPADHYDLVYDSGCFHHLPPHRRAAYVRLVVRALKPGAWLGLTCFTPAGGSGLGDDEVYARGTLGGGLGYTEQRLREIWSNGLQVLSVRTMQRPAEGSGLFGEPFLWALLARKPAA